MREDAFRRFLASRVSNGSRESYVAYVRRVESERALDLDAIALDPHAVERMREALHRRGVNAKSIGNCLTAVRRYGDMRGADG